jgi:DNA-binding PadR family transcriptional regulator
MSAENGRLPATAYAVLGLLSFGQELSGYELRRWALNLRFFYWSPAQSHIYLELRRLRRRGYVDDRLVAQNGRPDKRLYHITETGLAAFRDWEERAAVEPPQLKHSVALRLFFGHQASPERLAAMLDDYTAFVRTRLDELRVVHEGIAGNDAFTYPAMVAEWGFVYFEAELAAVERLRARLET